MTCVYEREKRIDQEDGRELKTVAWGWWVMVDGCMHEWGG